MSLCLLPWRRCFSSNVIEGLLAVGSKLGVFEFPSLDNVC